MEAEKIEKDLSMHRAVFENDIERVKSLLPTSDLATKDKYGNTPLHLAVMLGYQDIMELVLNESSTYTSNAQGWSPFDEAISRGDPKMVETLIDWKKNFFEKNKKELKNATIDFLTNMDDFTMDIHWEFKSWIPFVSRMLPSDTCRVSKRGTSIRMDATLVDFQDMKWQRGNLSLLFRAHVHGNEQLMLLDADKGTFLPIDKSKIVGGFASHLKECMTADITRSYFSTKNFKLNRVYTGWIGSVEKIEKVSHYMSDFHEVAGVQLVTVKRREHLTAEEVVRNKKLSKMIAFEEDDDTAVPEGQEGSRDRYIPPPPPCTLTWEEYHDNNNDTKDPPIIGRPQVVKTTRKDVKATVAISQEFPLSFETVMNILQFVAPFQRFDKLRNFVQVKLPPGFPVMIEFPILPVLSARVSFVEFEFKKEWEEGYFDVPGDYTLKKQRKKDTSESSEEKLKNKKNV